MSGLQITALQAKELDMMPTRLTPVTPGALLNTRFPAGAVISPDGKHVAFTLMERIGDEAKVQGRIWTVDTIHIDSNVEELKPLTKGPKAAGEPCWSPDGKQLAYTAVVGEGEKARSQLHIMSVEGREARQVCTMPNGVSHPAWSSDGTHIAFLSHEGEEPKTDPLIVVPARHQRLWTVHVESDRPTPVTPDGLTVWEYAWSPDSRQFALYYSVKPDENGWYAGQIGLVASGGGAVRQVTQLNVQAASLAWSPDATQLAYISGDWSDRMPGAGDIFVLSLDGGEPRNLAPGIESSPAWCRWFPDGRRLLFAAYSGVTQQIAILHEDGAITVLDDDFVMVWPSLSTTPDLHSFVTIHGTSQEMYDVWFGELTGDTSSTIEWHRLSRLNPLLEETFALAKTERIHYESVDSWQIDALFTPPSVRKTEGPPPLVVNVHGGPSWAWSDDMGLFWTQLLASAGYAVLRPNIRGSWGRGVAFANAVVGDMGGKDFQDIMHGVDYLIKRGLVDGDRLALAGWSYGGFMTAWAISQTTRFKAAVMGAGISDWHSFHAQSNLSDWDMRFLGADPLDNPEVYRERSPITYANRIITPTLILHGENDQPVPVNQGYAFHRALYERGVPVEFVVYPREGHGIAERDHIRDAEERVLHWLEKYV